MPLPTLPKATRRNVLRGAGVAVALPFLEALAGKPLRAAAPVGARRAIFFYSPNGQDIERFRPSGSGTDFTLGELQSPLAAIREHLTVFRGLENLAAKANPAGTNGHNAGITSILTCQTLSGDSSLYTVNNETRGYATGASFDTVLAQKLPGSAALKVPQLVLGAQTRGYEFGQRDPYSYVSYAAAGANGVNGANESPADVFRSLFADLQSGDSQAIERARAQRKSILDFVATSYSPQYSSLVKALPTSDQQRLDQHLQAIRELERRVSTLGASCQAPALGSGNDYGTSALSAEKQLGLSYHAAGLCAGALGKFADPQDSRNFPDVMRAHMDLVVLAMSCDLNRVATLQFSGAQSGPNHIWACALDESHHGITHNLGDPACQDSEAKITRWYGDQFVYLVNALKSVRLGDRSLFDDMALVWVTEMADAAGHTFSDLPIVLAGSAGGALKTGHLVDAKGRSQADVYVSLAQALGLDLSTFGDARFCNGELADMLA